MKIYDIINEEAVTEKPMGILKRAGLGIASKLGSAGAKAQLDVGKDANSMKKDLAAWMAGSGIAKGTLSPDDFKNFLGQKGLAANTVDTDLGQSRQASGRDPAEPMSNPEVDELLKKAVQAGFKSQGAKGRQSKFAAPAPAPAPASGPVDPKLQKAIAALQAAGYNVTK
jgi:hypothetical protein